MCGIVAATAQRNVIPILLECLKRLEYRGYDSAGLGLSNEKGQLLFYRQKGKVCRLKSLIETTKANGTTGIAHTRWATHGKPSEKNAHPQHSNNKIMVVHNGIIENHEQLRQKIITQGLVFNSETDTEVIAHLIAINRNDSNTLLEAVQKTVKSLKGAYSIAVMDKLSPNKIVVARSGSPLVIGIGIGEHFIASDQIALLPVTHRFQFLEEGDIAEITTDKVSIYDNNGVSIKRKIVDCDIDHEAGEKGSYRHFMLKEIYEQSTSISNTLEGRVSENSINLDIFSNDILGDFKGIENIQIVACGTSFHAALIARYWFEEFNIPCSVEIASEFRYRKVVVPKNCLFVTLSQSGETADTLSALKLAKELKYTKTLTICNVPGSSLVRESDVNIMTRAGVEIGVASTKGFTSQLTSLLMLVYVLGQELEKVSADQIKVITNELQKLPQAMLSAFELHDKIKELAVNFNDLNHAMFLGRGTMYPLAMEGALKLKEISYIHAEAYAAGELKHGPLALIDSKMPVVIIAPNDHLIEKIKANMEEVKARGGVLYVITDKDTGIKNSKHVHVIALKKPSKHLAPIVYSIPLQLLAYEVAVNKGTDIDQPRNLAKSVTVE